MIVDAPKKGERRTVTETIRARVRHGMLEPLEKLELPEGSEVTVTLVTGRTPDFEAFRRAAGGWKDIDAAKLIRMIYRSRRVSTRPVPRI